MNWKEFFKLDIKKLMLTLVFFISSSILFMNRGYVCIEGGFSYGFPQKFLLLCREAGVAIDSIALKPLFYIISLIIDLIFWYIISIILVYLYNILRKR